MFSNNILCSSSVIELQLIWNDAKTSRLDDLFKHVSSKTQVETVNKELNIPSAVIFHQKSCSFTGVWEDQK